MLTFFVIYGVVAGLLWVAVSYQVKSVALHVHKMKRDLAELIELWGAPLNVVPVRRFTVLVYGTTLVVREKEDTTEPFLWGKSGTIRPGESLQFALLANNVWVRGMNIVCIGDALLDGVLVGTREQVPWLVGGAPVCVTLDDVQVGTQLLVRVKGTEE